MDLKGRGAIITGSATGIGAAVAKKLALRGAKVAINYTKSEADAKATLAEIERAGGSGLLLQGDVALDADCRRIVEKAVAALGRLDILVNNAGTTKFADHANLDALSSEDFHTIYGVNVVGPFQMIRAAVPHMKKQGFGSVVNVSSIAGVTGIGSSVAYAASKGALNTMTLSLARALAPEVRVNAVCPGFVGTRWFKDRFGEEGFARLVEGQKSMTPLRRSGTPDDIAEAVVFFCAEGAEHITGETLLVDAGLHLNLTPLSQR